MGGAATFRFVHWAMPVVLVLLGLAIDRCAALLRRRWWVAAILVVSYMLSQRVFLLWPKYPGGVSTSWVFLTPLTVNPPVPDMVGMGSTYVRRMSLASYLVLSGALLAMLRPRVAG